MNELKLLNQKQIKVNELITLFILSQDVAVTSKKQYENSLRRYFAWVDNKGYELNNMTRIEILEYKQDLLKTGMSSLTVGAYLCACRKFYEYAESSKLYPNIAKGIKSPKRKNAFRKSALTIDQGKELLSYFKTQSLRDYAIINLLLRTGLRTIEVIRANAEDIKIKSGQRVLMIQGKGWDDKDAFVCLTDACFKAISDYLLTRGRVMGNKPLFACNSNNNKQGRLTPNTISYIVKAGLRAINLNDRSLSAHSLRHTCAVNILRSGGSLQDCQNVLRHLSSVTTQLYVSSLNESKRLENPAENLLDKVYED